MKYGKAWRGFEPKTRLLQIGMEQFLAGSDMVDTILSFDAGDIAYAFDLDTVYDHEVEKARAEIYEITQKSLNKRGVPNRFYVYRGGEIRGENVPVTFTRYIARDHAEYNAKRGDRSGLFVMMVNKKDVVADIDCFQDAYVEDELLVPRNKLEIVEQIPYDVLYK